MTHLRWRFAVACAVCLAQVCWVTAQAAPKADDLVGTWELVSTKNLKTGAVTQSPSISWMQFTKSHWMIINMRKGRKIISTADFEKLSPEAKVKANYARVWNEKNEQIFSARGGTFTLVGDRLHHPATVAIMIDIIGVDRVLRITHLDKATLVGETEYPDDPNTKNELTYRRID